MKKKRLRPRKSLGQHFLYDPAIAGKIISAAKLDPSELVVELGSGRGILTRPLAESGIRLIALEIDKNLSSELADFLRGPALEERGAGSSTESPEGTDKITCGGPSRETPAEGAPWNRVEIINADFTKLSLTGLLTARGFERCVLIGNIPYNLTRHVLFSFLVDEVEVIKRAYLTVQREVGERIVSGPGGRTYGITSVILQSLYHTRPVLKVSAGSFYPRPKVDSIIIEFLPREEPLVNLEELKRFTQFVKNLFQQRRKTIHNLLKTFYTLSEQMLKELHAATGIDLKRRPEALSKEEILKLFETLDEVARV